MAGLLPRVQPEDARVEPVGAMTGASWRIRGGAMDVLARENSSFSALLGVNRRREGRLLRRLAGAFPAPKPRGQLGQWLVVDWLAGENLSGASWQAVLDGDALPALVARLHRAPRHGHPLDLRARYARYWQASCPARRCPAWLRLHQHFMHAARPAPLCIAPLHMDIHAGNVLLGPDGALRLIDWEYAGDGDIALELAALFRANEMDERRQAVFLQAYQPRAQGYTQAALRRQVALWLPWVDYLLLMWYEACWRQTRREQCIVYATPLRRHFGLPF